jgi:hypothetical protein
LQLISFFKHSKAFTFCKLLKGCFLCILNRCAGLSFKFDTFLTDKKHNKKLKQERNVMTHPPEEGRCSLLEGGHVRTF